MSPPAGGQGPSIALPGTTGAQRVCSAAPHPEHGWRLSSRGRECLSEQCRRLPGKASGRRQAVRCRLPTPPGSTHLTHGGVTPRANAKLSRLLVLKTVPRSCLHSFPSLQTATAVCELLNSQPSVAGLRGSTQGCRASLENGFSLWEINLDRCCVSIQSSGVERGPDRAMGPSLVRS